MSQQQVRHPETEKPYVPFPEQLELWNRQANDYVEYWKQRGKIKTEEQARLERQAWLSAMHEIFPKIRGVTSEIIERKRAELGLV